MVDSSAGHAIAVERSCALVASVLSDGRSRGVRLLSGDRRCFGTSEDRTLVHVPYPTLAPGWTLRTFTCGIALQCSPSKEHVACLPLQELTARELRALTIVEGEVALGWVTRRWPGLMPDLGRLLPALKPRSAELDGRTMLDHAIALARSTAELRCDPLLGELPRGTATRPALSAWLRRMYGQLPWAERTRVLSPGPHTIPGGGLGGDRNPNLPPPSRPEEEDPEVCADRRVGIPYPEWNVWTERFLRDHVAVLERKHASRARQSGAASVNLRRWFEAHTYRVVRNRLEDGSDLDVDQYVEHFVDTVTGEASEARLFRDLLPGSRDVATALLLDGSSSLGVHHGRVFQLELACADALCHAMALARERHALFAFSGNTRHRVDVTCLKDFDDVHAVIPSDLGLSPGGYTRLGAPLRHMTMRLLGQAARRRLLIAIGDGMISDDGYEGRYAWADTAHAVEEAGDAGVAVYYIGVGRARVDPLPDVFGWRRSTRITRVEDLPGVLARVHGELVAA
jgi:hypothetical protein